MRPSSWVASAAAEECAAWPFGRPDLGGGGVIGNLETSVHDSFNRAACNKHIIIIAVRLIIIKPLQFHLKLDSLGRSHLLIAVQSSNTARRPAAVWERGAQSLAVG